MPDLGVRLQLLIGPTVPIPAPFAVVDALVDLEVTNKDRAQDGFAMTLTLGKERTNYGLLADGTLDPPSRVIVQVIINGRPQVLIDGLITEHEVIPSNEPGRSRLSVKGVDISQQLALEDRNKPHGNQSDSDVVSAILKPYLKYGIRADVEDTKVSHSESERKTWQNAPDLAFVRALASRNQFVFYVEPTDVPGSSVAHWGREKRDGTPQSALTMNMGASTNVDEPIRFRFDALRATNPEISILDPTTKRRISVPVPTGFLPGLSRDAAKPLRTTIARDTANLSLADALLRALNAGSEGSAAVDATGTLDSIRYGQVLRARRPVDVRGVGKSYDGRYYVSEVTHRLARGSYKQHFSLLREGRGATSDSVTM